MKSLAAVMALILAAPALGAEGAHPFDVHDLVMMDRVSDPSLSPDGKLVAFQVRETDYDADKGTNGIWIVPANGGKSVRLTDKALNATSPRWSRDGAVYFLAPKDGTSQLWRVGADGGSAEQATSLALDVNNFKLSPDGRHVLLSLDVFTDCDDIACTQSKLDERRKSKSTGMIYDSIFVRHWDTWSDGRRSQLFIADVGDGGKIGAPRWLTKGIDVDVPS
jgi:dipeptidyl aminopeptidase/acylaminoacyl peptidase